MTDQLELYYALDTRLHHIIGKLEAAINHQFNRGRRRRARQYMATLSRVKLIRESNRISMRLVQKLLSY